MTRIGLGVRPSPNITERKAPIIAPDDWREENGTVYNVAVKRRYQENGGDTGRYLSQEARNKRPLVLPGWERLEGTIRKTQGNTITLETRLVGNELVDGRKIQITNYPKPEVLKLHTPLVIYAYRIEDYRFDYGRLLTASEAQARLAARTNAISLETKTPDHEKQPNAPVANLQKSE